MKRISKAQIEERERIKGELEEHKAEVSRRVSAANAVIADANEWIGKVNDEINSVNEAIANYNQALSDGETWAQEVAGEIQSYMDERSDKWQESDAAEYYREWLSPYESYAMDEVPEVAEVPEIEEIEEPDMDHADDFNEQEYPEEKPS